jgi:Integrase core domain
VTGWEFVHVAVDDATRLAHAEARSDERRPTAAGFLSRAVAWFASFGIAVERILSDNGACYRSRAHALANWAASATSLRGPIGRAPIAKRSASSKPRQPLGARRDLSIVSPAHHSAVRLADHHNFTRRHGSLSHKPPATRPHELTNLAGNYSQRFCLGRGRAVDRRVARRRFTSALQ